SRAGLEENLRRFGAGRATILEGDSFEVLEGGALGDRRVGVYYYDGAHDYDAQMRGLRAVEPWRPAGGGARGAPHPRAGAGGAAPGPAAVWGRGRRARGARLAGAAAGPRHRPLGQVEPVRAAQRLDD